MDRKVYVEIIAKKKGCMLCDLALAVLEEIAPEFEPGVLTWEVVDMGSREGLWRHEELTRLCGRKPAVPSIVINEKIAFDHIPEMGELSEAVQEAWEETGRIQYENRQTSNIERPISNIEFNTKKPFNT